MGLILGDHITPTTNDIVMWDGTKWVLVPYGGQPTYPVFTSTILYNAIKSNSYEELDCGVGSAIVYIKIELVAAAGAGHVRLMPNDEANEDYPVGAGDLGTGSSVERLSYAMVVTDSAGKVKWKSLEEAIVITLTLIGYWPNPPKPNSLIFDGVSVLAWTELTVGVKNALAILKVTNDGAAAVRLYTRMRGESKDITFIGNGVSCCETLAVGEAAYILVATDAEGKIEFHSPEAGRDYTVHLTA